MKRHLVHLLFAALLLVSFQVGWQSVSFAFPGLQSDCIEQVVKNTEVIANQALDVDQDGKLDQVVLYGKDQVDVLVILNRSPANCEVSLNEYLANLILGSPTAWRTAKVRKIEMIELTGDNKPELYIWLETSGAGPRYEHSVHAIYRLVNGSWQKVLHISQCLAFSSFEFRDLPTGAAKYIYLDEDTSCQPPRSAQRTYTIMRWNGSKFWPSESGTLAISTTNPPWWNAFCVTILIAPVVVVVLAVIHWKRKRSNEVTWTKLVSQ